jgi:hypothetical protein
MLKDENEKINKKRQKNPSQLGLAHQTWIKKLRKLHKMQIRKIKKLNSQ